MRPTSSCEVNKVYRDKIEDTIIEIPQEIVKKLGFLNHI